MPNKRDKGHLTAAIHAIRDMVLGVREDDLDADADALATHLTNSDIQKALQAALKREKEGERGQQDAYYDCYVIDIEDDQVIYSENGKTYRRPFTTDEENRVSFSGDAEEVQTDTRYLPVANAVKAGDSGHTHPPTQETNMDTNMQARVQHLIVHAHTAWTDQDAELLATFSEAQLVRLEAEAEARASQATAATDTHDAPDQEKEQDAEAGAAETVHPVTQHAHVAPANKASHASVALTLDAIRGVIHEEMDTRLATFETQIEARRERQQLVTQLTALGWTAEETRGMSHDALRKLASTLTPTNFVGMGLPALGTQAADDGPTDDPDWQ